MKTDCRRVLRQTRRPWLRLLSVALILIAVGLPGSRAERNPVRPTHGPMLGRPTATSMLIWGRTSDPGTFTVHFGTAENKQNQVSEPATTTIEPEKRTNTHRPTIEPNST